MRVLNGLFFDANGGAIQSCAAIVAIHPLRLVLTPTLGTQKFGGYGGAGSGGHAADSVLGFPPSAVFGLSLAAPAPSFAGAAGSVAPSNLFFASFFVVS